MILNLSAVEFNYDFFSASMPDGSLLVLNKIDENLRVGDNDNLIINRINIAVAPVDGSERILCSSVIGTGNKYFNLNSGYSEQQGKILTLDNMKYCTMEIFENE